MRPSGQHVLRRVEIQNCVTTSRDLLVYARHGASRIPEPWKPGGSRACGIFIAAVFFLLAVLPPRIAAQKASMAEVGIVVPKEVITGETISAAMVTNPRDYTALPRLQVAPARLPGIPGVNTGDLLNHYKIQAGDSTNFVPADGPFSFTAVDNLQIKIMRSDIENAKVITTRVPLTVGGASSTSPRDSGYRTPPLTLAGAVHLIHGPLSGNSNQTRITLNGAAIKILAESPRDVFYLVPPTLTPGPVEWQLDDGGRRTRLKTWVLALQISADKLKLEKGESTAFHVYIRGVETIPKEVWFGSGSVSTLVDPSFLNKFLPDFKTPGPLQPGVLVLTLENTSAGTAEMSDGNRVALTFGYGQPKYEHHGTIKVTRAGSFNIEVTLIAFLHDLPAEGMLADNAPQPPGNAGVVVTPSAPQPTPAPTAAQEPATVGRNDNPAGHTPSPTPNPATSKVADAAASDQLDHKAQAGSAEKQSKSTPPAPDRPATPGPNQHIQWEAGLKIVLIVLAALAAAYLFRKWIRTKKPPRQPQPGNLKVKVTAGGRQITSKILQPDQLRSQCLTRVRWGLGPVVSRMTPQDITAKKKGSANV